VQSPNVCHALVQLTNRPHTPDQHPTPEPHTGRAFVIPKAVTMPQLTTTERGYGADHQRQRKALTPTVDAGQAWCTEPICLMDDRWIQPGTPWDLAHNREAGPGQYRGPAHARCNRSEGARFRDSREAEPLNRWIL
jgi:hypothetical protein